MKTHPQPQPSRRRRHPPRGIPAAGFALVVTISLMVLLTVVAVGLLGLSAVTLRAAGQGAALAEARANARMALLLALGELQKSAGIDQRITAPAAILDADPATDTIDRVGEPNITGVWRSYSIDPTKSAAAPDYNKRDKFVRWLVSGLSEAEATNPDALAGNPFRTSGAAAPAGVRLVGPGTTKADDPSSPLHVWAGRNRVLNTAGATTGGFAYAALDEGAKARVDLALPAGMPAAERPLTAPGAPLRTGFELAGDAARGGDLADYARHRDNCARIITLPTATLLGGAADKLPDLGGFFNDLTTDSLAVMADVAAGGLRKDLSLFGELATLPTDYADRRLYSNSATPLAAEPASRAGYYNAGSPDPYWAMIHDSLRTDKRLTPGRGAGTLPTLPIPLRLPRGYLPGGGDATTFRINRGSQKQLPMAPVIVRCEIIFSFGAVENDGHSPWQNEVPSAFGENWRHQADMCLWYTPLVTLWNPYNVPLTLSQPLLEISTPPLGFRFRRHRCSDPKVGAGYVNGGLVPLDDMFVNAGQRYTKKFVMQLFNTSDSSGGASGDLSLLPGEVKLFSPVQRPTSTYYDIFDYRNDLTDRPGGSPIKAAPGYRGPQYGYSIDWVTGKGAADVDGGSAQILPPQAGVTKTLGVLGSLWDDQWDIEYGPAPAHLKGGAVDASPFTVSLLTSAAASDTTGASLGTTVLSRLVFDYGGNLDTLRTALTPPTSTARNYFPVKMSSYLPVVSSAQIRVPYVGGTIPNWVVQPFMVMCIQAKTSNSSPEDEPFPARSWVHNNATRPLAYIDLKLEKQAWASHELALIPFKNGMNTDAKIDRNNRSYALSGIYKLTGSSFGIHRELPVLPIQSVAQLGHFDLAANAYPGAVDHPVGSSLAHPLVDPSAVVSSLPGVRYQTVDHAWLANFRLWDGWYASTFENYTAPCPRVADLRTVTTQFLTGERPLFNPRFQPWTGGRDRTALAATLATGPAAAAADGYLRAASVQLLRGGFNVNSTSKAAWKALLGGLSGESLALLDSATGRLLPNGTTPAGPYLSRQRLPGAKPNQPGAAPSHEVFWQGGVQLTPEELDALAAAILREVKSRGPFLSLAEFVNRRLGSPASDPLHAKGPLQAAIDDAPPIGDLNRSGARAGQVGQNTRILTPDEVAKNAYLNPAAATGSTSSGAAGNLDQLAVLTQIGPFVCARSDTFKIRCYGEATDAAGKVLATAWLEAVVQRTPDYLVSVTDNPSSTKGNLPFEPPNDTSGQPSSALHPANLRFGRRFAVVSTKWLSPDEV